MWYDNEISRGIMTKKYLHEGEEPSQFLPRVASIFSPKIRKKVLKALENADFLPAGRTLFGAGYKGERKVSMSNCYIVPTPNDAIEEIFDTAKMIARISSYGGGCGVDISKLRPKGAKVNNSAMTSTGAVSFLNLFDVTGSTIGQQGRRAALMVGLSCDHPDIEEFLHVKQRDEKLSSMNISIKFTDEFMEAVRDGKEFTLKFDAPTEHIEKVIDARKFFNEFCETQWDYGDPGAMFIDRINSFGLLSGYDDYHIDITNPCAEYPGNGGNSCNLGSINLYNVIDDKFTDHASVNYDKLKDITSIAVKALDEILDYGYDMQPLDINRQCISDWRSIGLGVFGLADALVAMEIRYGSQESREVVSDIMECILTSALHTSATLAKTKGTFKKYRWEATKESAFIKAYKGDPLYDMVKENGLRNGTLISVAPTGTISLFSGGFTGGVEPMYQVSYERTTHSTEDAGKKFTVYARGVRDLLKFHGLRGLTTEQIKERFPFVIESHEVPPADRVALQGVMQDYVDCAISSTVNLPNSATPQDIYGIYMDAWEQGCKGITVFRDGCKRGNILGVKAPQTTYNTIEPAKRRETQRVNGSTFKQSSSCVPSMYVTVNKAESGDIFEVFTNASGGCQANISTITRLISLALRSGVKVSKVIDELRENRCNACQLLRRQGKNVSLSCGNAIADAIESMIDGTKSEVIDIESNGTVLLPCPECGKKTLRPEGKCYTCSNCGYNACE